MGQQCNALHIPCVALNSKKLGRLEGFESPLTGTLKDLRDINHLNLTAFAGAVQRNGLLVARSSGACLSFRCCNYHVTKATTTCNELARVAVTYLSFRITRQQEVSPSRVEVHMQMPSSSHMPRFRGMEGILCKDSSLAYFSAFSHSRALLRSRLLPAQSLRPNNPPLTPRKASHRRAQRTRSRVGQRPARLAGNSCLASSRRSRA